jgi:glucose-1-phosphate cytidylyltransferase
MKVVIFCGGMGTRLREETEYKPKPMVEIGGRPILWHIMKTYSMYGFNDFVLCLGYRQNAIREYFLNYEYMNNDFTINLKSREKMISHLTHNDNWNVTLVDTGLKSKKGTRIKKIEPYIKENSFMVTYGDGIGNINIKELVNHHTKSKKLVTFTGVHPTSRFATIGFNDDGSIISWKEKGKMDEYINVGFMVLNRKVFAYLDDDCELEEEPMERLAQDKQIAMYKHNDFWHCMDTYRDYIYLEGLWQKDQAPWKIWK